MKSIVSKIIVGALLVAPVFAVPAMAQEGENDDQTTTTKMDTSAKREELSKKREALKGRLSDAKKKICEKRVERITSIMSKASQGGEKGQAFFGSAYTRIKEFYAKKNLSVANYDALVAAVDAKKAAAQAAIDAVKSNTSFSCDGDNPIASIDAFNGKIRTMHAALKDYRAAVKALLKAVKEAARAAEKTTGGDQ
jgi:hypothetical protein